MSGFLDRLAARAGDGPAAVRPRLGSRFEPAAPTGPAELEVVVEVGNDTTPGGGTVAAPAGSGPRADATVSIAVKAPHGATAPATAATHGAASAGAESTGGATSEPDTTEQASSGPATQPPMPETRMAEVLPVDPPHESLPPVPAPAPQHVAPDDGAAVVLAATPVPILVAPTPARSPDRQRFAPDPFSRPEASPSSAWPTKLDDVPNVVHVTIGRVEIRTRPGRATAQRAPSEPQVSTLEDYLQRRSSGTAR